MTSDNSKLERRIAAAISNGSASSAALMELVNEVSGAAEAAEQAATAERDKALDLTISDIDTAHAALVAAELFRDRLRAVLPRLRQRLTEALGAEAHARWFAVYERVEKLRDAAAEKFARQCPELLASLVGLLREADAVDQEVSRVNSAAPSGERRRLLGVEQTVRGTTKPAIAQSIRLPDWDGQISWPPQQPNELAVAVAASMMPPHDVRFTSRWYEAVEADNAERRQLAERRVAEQEAEQVAARQRYETSLLEQEKERERAAHERRRM
jgi:hypothetical protein